MVPEPAATGSSSPLRASTAMTSTTDGSERAIGSCRPPSCARAGARTAANPPSQKRPTAAARLMAPSFLPPDRCRVVGVDLEGRHQERLQAARRLLVAVHGHDVHQLAVEGGELDRGG